MLVPWKKSYDKPRQCVEKQRHYFADKGPYSQIYDFALWELDHKEGWRLKNWCFQTVVLEKTLENHWTARRWNHSILKDNNPEYSLGGLMLKLKLQYFGHLIRRANLLEKTLMLGKIEGRRRRRWHHWLNGHEFEQILGDSEGQGSLACCSPWGRKESDMTE